MKINRKAALVLLLSLVLLLPGCAVAEPIGSEVWETMPQLTFGVMEYEKLQVLPWNAGRCEATSCTTMAETEMGYYLPFAKHCLYYAEKADMSQWKPVCTQSDCSHDERCSSYREYEEVVAQNGKLYGQVCAADAGLPVETSSGAEMVFLVSMDPDGDKRAVAAEPEYIPANVTSCMSLLTTQHWLYNIVEQMPDGSRTARFYRLTDSGWKMEAEVEDYKGDPTIKSAKDQPLYGDPLFHNEILNANPDVYYRYRNGVLEELDLTKLPPTLNFRPGAGNYVSGDIARYFMINDGYYDVNIKTGEKVKVAEAQLENSFASIVLPNCVVESTLLTFAKEWHDRYYMRGMKHEMRLFDGESWRKVELPKELLSANGQTYIKIVSVTSDSVIFFCKNMMTYRRDYITNYYKIDLTLEELKAELFYSFCEER